MFRFEKKQIFSIISNKFRRTDTDLVYLFTNARDEPNIAEWIAHHLLLGFDKIYVFDHLSSEPIISKLRTNFDNKVHIMRAKGSGNIKIQFMKDAVNIANNNNVSWMLYLDADEFLLINKYNNIKDYLRNFNGADSIGINWLMFGSSGHTTQPKGLLTENFIYSDIILDQHVKSFVRPHIVTDVINPHFYIITNPNRYYTGNGTKMQMGPFNPQPLPFINSLSYIAHYYMQSEEEYKRRKGRARDDGSPINLNLKNNFYKKHNTINNQLQNKYSQRIKEFLQKYSIEL